MKKQYNIRLDEDTVRMAKKISSVILGRSELTAGIILAIKLITSNNLLEDQLERKRCLEKKKTGTDY